MATNEIIPGQAINALLPKIMVISRDLKLLKLLDIGLRLELLCDVLCFTHSKSAQETAKHTEPDLLILDGQDLNCTLDEGGWRLYNIKGLEQVPTLLLNAVTESLDERQRPSTIVLTAPWQMETLYAAILELLSDRISLQRL
jgi:hypothetical protein